MPLIINGQIVAQQALDEELLRLSQGLRADAPEAGGLQPHQLQSTALRNIIGRTLLLQAAAAEDMYVTADEIEAEAARRWSGRGKPIHGEAVRLALGKDLLVQRISLRLTRHVPRPGRAEAEAFYRRNQHLYFLPEAVQAAHIVRNISSPDEESLAMAALEQAEAELARGKAFASVADRHSDCRGVGGSLGWVSRGQMVPEFEAVIFALAPGKRSGIFRTVFGLHIATVLRMRAEGYRPFEEVRLPIASQLFSDRRRTVLLETVAAMERGSHIQYTEEAVHG